MGTTRSVEFTEQALRTLKCVGEVARTLAASPEMGHVLADNHHLRQVLLFGYRITYLLEDEDILVLTARPASGHVTSA
jgi:plasmid stabilization system protein ParE